MDKFCDSLTRFSRRPTDEVRIGAVGVGGDNPIRLQSMTNTDTNDTEASAAQVERIAAAGGEIVRLTAQGRREAANLGRIRALLDNRGCRVPLVADIHFLPAAALVAAEQVEKVRINPGNWNERGGEFDELLSTCRRRGVALRIGVNHGSLSPSIMERYGDTVEGMVASAMEYLRRCREASFGQVVVSIKSSNVRVMVQAYRMLVAAMRREGMRYPLHLGVTEAGTLFDGAVKSAMGLGIMLHATDQKRLMRANHEDFPLLFPLPNLLQGPIIDCRTPFQRLRKGRIFPIYKGFRMQMTLFLHIPVVLCQHNHAS